MGLRIWILPARVPGYIIRPGFIVSLVYFRAVNGRWTSAYFYNNLLSIYAD